MLPRLGGHGSQRGGGARAAIALFGLRIPADRWLPLISMGLLAATAGGVGLGLGARLRDYRTLQPLIGVTFAGSFFASGGCASVATLLPVANAFNIFWPPAYVFEAMQSLMHRTEVAAQGVVWIGRAAAAVVVICFGAGMLRRTYRASAAGAGRRG